jgi:ribonuclease HI
MKHVIIYTDGACSVNPGVGGWGAVLIYGKRRRELSGSEAQTTNNRMELTAVIEAVKALNQPCEIDVFTDSSYVCNAFKNGWIWNWLRNGWKTANKHPVENQDLWQELLACLKIHKVNWNKVKGHADNEYNNRCDKLATTAVAELKKKIETEKQERAKDSKNKSDESGAETV